MIRRIATALTAASAVVLLSAGVAQAADTRVYTQDLWGTYLGSATWTENGDSMEVCDTAADGWGVRGYIYVPNAPFPEDGTVLIKGNDPSSDGKCAAFSKNISETTALSIKVCIYRGSSVTYCEYRRIR